MVAIQFVIANYFIINPEDGGLGLQSFEARDSIQ